MVRLQLHTLGRTEAWLDGAEASALSSTKVGVLLSFLAMEHQRSVPRPELARQFWPDQAPEVARGNLRQALFQLRRQLGDLAGQVLKLDARYVRFIPGPAVQVDALQLEARAASRREPVPTLIDAVRGFRGHFLAELSSVQDIGGLEDWLIQSRQRVWRTVLSLLEQCVARAGASSEAVELIHELQRLVVLEPLDEQLQGLLMRALAGTSQPTRALDCYLEFEAHLRRELDTRPGPSLRRLYTDLRSRLAPGAGAHAAVEDVSLRPERRRVAVVVCDFRPPARDPGQTDVETLTAAVQQGTARVEATLFNHRGHIVRLPWACLLGYFGYPSGREEATLDALDAVWEALRGMPDGARPRIAVDSDVIITGSDPEVPDPAGLLTDRALRLAAVTAPGTVSVSSGIHERFRGHFRFVTEGLPAPRLVHHPGHADRVEAQAARALAPLVGREQPLSRLEAAWQRACSGQCTSLVIRSEAGLGKSRLARGLIEAVDGQAQLVLMLPCRQRFERQLLMPVRQAFARWVGPEPAWRRGRARRRLIRWQLQRHLQSPALVRRVARWLVDTDDRSLIHQGGDRDRLLDALVQLLADRARSGPVLLVCDDAHWIDSGTAELLRRVQRRLARQPVLIIFTGRMSFRSEWLHTAPAELRLSGLSDGAGMALINALDREQLLPDPTREAICRRAEGVPLFLEELTLHAIQRRRAGEPEAALPPALSDLLVARLEGLGGGRELAHAAAVIGRDFDIRLLARLTGQNLDQVQTVIKQLVALGFVERDVALVASRYRFRHALYHQAAYEALPATERRALHGRLAQLLEEDAELGVGNTEPEILAEHLREAGRPDDAVEQWLLAGDQAIAQGMLPEAEQHYADAQALLDRVGEADGRLPWVRQKNLRALVGLGVARLGLAGYGAEPVVRTFERAFEMADERADRVLYFQALWGLWHGSGSREGTGEAHRLALEMDRLAERSGDRLLRVAAQYAQGNAHFWTARYSQALTHQQRALALAREGDHATLIARHGESPVLTVRAVRAWTLHVSGRRDAAWAEIDAARAEAAALQHRPTQAFVEAFRGGLGFFDDAPRAALESAEHTMALAVEHRLPLWQVAGTAVRAWAQARLGESSALEALREQVQVISESMGGVSTLFRLFLIDALPEGDPSGHRERLTTANRALADAARTGDDCYLPMIQRLRGRTLLTGPAPREAEAGWRDLSEARALAARQGALGLELRVLRDMLEFAGPGAGRSALAEDLMRLEQRLAGIDAGARPVSPTKKEADRG